MGDVRRVLVRLRELFLQGMSVPDAFASMRPTISDLEISLIEASGNSGRLEQAFTYLADYFGTLATVRAGIVKQAAWPLIQLHLGIIVLNAVALFIAVASIYGLIWYKQARPSAFSTQAFSGFGL